MYSNLKYSFEMFFGKARKNKAHINKYLNLKHWNVTPENAEK